MSRTMQIGTTSFPRKGALTYEVIEHIILKNSWEYYMVEPFDDGIGEAWVMGLEDEYGAVSLDEIKPFILSRTKDLNDVMPATGFTWIEEGK